jgi:hypothetical protein
VVAPLAAGTDRPADRPSFGVVVLDVDIKDPGPNVDSLAELGLAPLPDTPLVHTQSGGLHIYFAAGQH